MTEGSLYQQVIDEFMTSLEGDELTPPRIRDALREQLVEERPAPERKQLLDLLRTEE